MEKLLKLRDEMKEDLLHGSIFPFWEQYTIDHENGGFYDIRDICRIDPTVVPLLSLPYGTRMEKDETGEWIEIEDDETERS